MVHLQLHLLLSVGTVILEERVSNGIVSQLRDGLQAPLVEQCPIEPYQILMFASQSLNAWFCLAENIMLNSV